ncbi:hypothetical protein CLOLEP_03961 [[Clostridium] leptum DSM 753]|uniref:Uncharacterized protein n=1 Tax=[Clostridium] leptum DSM 753 TaxID=428125 RepID=A7VZD2_9FIRM|nr:hypothetical protein CLOLEP_03961 [[Clostridium] leptum DSM 753]
MASGNLGKKHRVCTVLFLLKGIKFCSANIHSALSAQIQ